MRQAVLANTAALIGGLLALSPALAPLSAQAASTCDVDQNKPKELPLATLSLSKASSLTAGPARETVLRQIAKDLLDQPAKFAVNPGGYNYLLTRLYTLMAQQPNGMNPTTRGAIGLTTRPGDPFDVVVELDSAFIKFEAAAPSCKADIAASRTNEAWLAVTKRAFDASQAGQHDSAAYYARRSLTLAKENPFPHHILASVAQEKKDMPAAVAEWREVVRLAGTDTSYRDIKLSSLFYLGVNELTAAAGKSGEAQKAGGRAAAGYLSEFLAANPTSGDAPSVIGNLTEALLLAADTAKGRAIYTDHIANPTKYSESILAASGVAAARFGDEPSAMKLFQSTVDANPNSRDGLRNLASMQYSLKQFDKMFTPLNALVVLDPNNYDAWMMYAFGAQDLGKASKVPAEKKAWTDTLVKYSGIADKLAAKVEVISFNRGPSSAELTLQVEQMADNAGTYTVNLEFLDVKGAVVSSDSKPIGPIAKGEKKNVTLKGTGAGIVAYRYKKLG